MFCITCNALRSTCIHHHAPVCAKPYTPTPWACPCLGPSIACQAHLHISLLDQIHGCMPTFSLTSVFVPIQGFWLGLWAASSVQVVIQLAVILNLDWDVSAFLLSSHPLFIIQYPQYFIQHSFACYSPSIPIVSSVMHFPRVVWQQIWQCPEIDVSYPQFACYTLNLS